MTIKTLKQGIEPLLSYVTELASNSRVEEGVDLGIYEMLDILKNELLVRDVDMTQVGLNMSLEKLVFGHRTVTDTPQAFEDDEPMCELSKEAAAYIWERLQDNVKDAEQQASSEQSAFSHGRLKGCRKATELLRDLFDANE